ncbi:hypothetical protein Tco_0286012 [Tanacetum coccineum]
MDNASKYHTCVKDPPTRIISHSRLAAGSACLSAAHLSAKPALAESTQQSSHLSGPQSSNLAQLKHQPAPICLQHGPSGTLSPIPVPQPHRPSGLTPQWLPRWILKSSIIVGGTGILRLSEGKTVPQ